MSDSKEDWERIEPLLDRALDLEDSERRDFLDELGERDPLLLDRLRTLLRASEDSDLLIDKPLHSVAGGLVGKVPIEKLDPALGPGKIVGVYRILEELGEGGMGRVFLAERADGEYRQRVALKVLNEQSDTSNESYSRFRRERQILADLKHEGIARLLDGGVTKEGRPYFALEYVDGVPLIEYCKSRRLPAEERLRLLLQVCEAVHYAHQRGVVHRDLKPSNLLVEEDPERGRRVCVLDFGIAHHGRTHEITLTGQIMGTPGYMSPEQAKGLSHLVDRRSDVFALGVLLYEMLTDRQPFGQDEAISAADVLLNVADASFEPVREVLPEIPEDLAVIVDRCLAKRPEDRYDSMRSLGTDLEAYLEGQRLADRGRVLPKVRGAMSRHPVGWAVAAVLVVASLAVAGLAWRGRLEARQRLQVEESLEASREITSLIRSAHLSEVDDLRPARGEVELRLASLESRLERASGEVRAASEYALGVGALELGSAREALRRLSSAWEGGLQTREVALSLVAAEADRSSLGVSLGLLLGGLDGWEEPLSGALREQLGARLTAQREEGAPAGLGEALRARLEGRHRDVLALVEAAVAREPWRYDAYLVAADSAVELARAEVGERDRWQREAARLLEAAAEQGRSDPRVYDRLCGLGLWRAMASGVGPASVSSCRRSLRLDPRRYEPQLLLAAGAAVQAASSDRPEEARRELERGAEASLTAAQLAPDDPLVVDVRRRLDERLAALGDAGR